MPITVTRKKSNQNNGNGWGCNDPSFRLGEPSPEMAVKALARSAVVTVEDFGTEGGYRRFQAWTDPDNRYEVAYGEGPGGFCKHVVACLFVDHPWLRQAALGAHDWMEELESLRKENKKLRKENEQWKKKSTP